MIVLRFLGNRGFVRRFAGRFFDGVNVFCCGDRLSQPTARASLGACAHRFGVASGADNEYPSPVSLRADSSGGRDAIHLGHTDIHTDDVRLELAEDLNCLQAVFGLPYDGYLPVGLQSRAERCPQFCLIFSD